MEMTSKNRHFKSQFRSWSTCSLLADRLVEHWQVIMCDQVVDNPAFYCSCRIFKEHDDAGHRNLRRKFAHIPNFTSVKTRKCVKYTIEKTVIRRRLTNLGCFESFLRISSRRFQVFVCYFHTNVIGIVNYVHLQPCSLWYYIFRPRLVTFYGNSNHSSIFEFGHCIGRFFNSLDLMKLDDPHLHVQTTLQKFSKLVHATSLFYLQISI